MNNQEFKVRPQNINDPYIKLCDSDVVKNMNVKVFNLISRTNETRYINWYESCKRKCRLDASLSDNKQRGNKEKCRRECKELIVKGICDKGFNWNPSNCECECDKSDDVSKNLDYKNKLKNLVKISMRKNFIKIK